MSEIAYTLDDLRAMFRECAAEMTASRTGMKVTWKTTDRRTQEQNDKIQPMARDISKAIQWSVAGEMRTMPPAKWRHFFAGHIRAESWMVPKIDGDGILILGVGSSELSVKEASDCVELMYAFGGERGVVWSEQTKRLLR